MKRIVTLFLIVTLVFSLSISAFADYESFGLPSIDSYLEEYSYAVLAKEADSDRFYLYLFDREVTGKIGNKSSTSTTQVYWFSRNPAHQYTLTSSNPTWSGYASNYCYGTELLWSNFDLYHTDTGEIIIYGSSVYPPPECDGTSCPANDIDHDNICDDCGNVLTFSLRSTLLDYAKQQAEELGPFASTHKYYAIVEHPTEPDSYFIYVSEILMGCTDGNSVTGGNVKIGQVVIMEDGRNATRGGWTSIDSWSGKVVYANQTIPFFFRVPLKVTVQGPTGEQMEMEAPNLTKDFSTLAICGIGCLALLILLRLFRASLTNFLN